MAVAGAVIGLLLMTIALSALADRFSIPPPVLLVIAGIVIGELPGVPSVSVEPELVSLLVLPPLLYATALEVPVRELRQDKGQIASLAIGLVLLTTATVAAVAKLTIGGITLPVAILLGALLSSVDPVAIAALARQMHLPRRLLTVVQSESLLNDASSLVTYRVVVAVVVAGGATTFGSVAGNLLLLAGGGIACGLVAGFVTVQVRRFVHEGETLLALATPFGAYVGAEAIGASGVTAVVVAGLYVGPQLGRHVSASSRLREQSLFAVIVFALEGLVFSLIGLELPALLRQLPAETGGSLAVPTLLVVATVVLTRVVWVFAASRMPGQRSEGWQTPTFLSWAGTRGVVALAAALSVPATTEAGAPFPFRAELLVITIVVIIATLVVQGLTLAPLAKRLGVGGDPEEDRREETLARHRAAQAALVRLEEILDADPAHPATVERLRSGLVQRVDRTRQPVSDGTGDTFRRLRKDLLDVERREVLRLRDTGEVSERVVAKVLRSFDLEAAALR